MLFNPATLCSQQHSHFPKSASVHWEENREKHEENANILYILCMTSGWGFLLLFFLWLGRDKSWVDRDEDQGIAGIPMGYFFLGKALSQGRHREPWRWPRPGPALPRISQGFPTLWIRCQRRDFLFHPSSHKGRLREFRFRFLWSRRFISSH